VVCRQQEGRECPTLAESRLFPLSVQTFRPGRVEHSQIPVFKRADTNLKTTFEKHLQDAGGVAYNIESGTGAQAKLAALHPAAQVIFSAVPEFPVRGAPRRFASPHELANVDVRVIRAQFGVADSGAVWLTEEDLIVNGLGFLSQHLVVLLDPNEIVAGMHDAYARVRLDGTAYGCFMMEPSATGDVEGTLVHGAQGARSLNLFFLSTTGA
jgi:L-lactate dehydrogenase complex protein LldG